MDNHIKASIIIPTQNKMSRLRLVLNALALQVNETHEVILVMDGCNRETLAEFAKIKWPFPIITVIRQQSGSRAAARNHGIRMASGAILIFMDDDRIPGPGFIAGHIAAHQTQSCLVLGKRMELALTEAAINELGACQEFSHRLATLLARAKYDLSWLKNKIYLMRLSPVPWLACVTSNLSVRKADMVQVGLFDENYTGWGWEDSDLGYRFLQNQIPIVKNCSLINYHLVHAKPQNLKTEELNNYRYFYAKTKADPVTRFSLLTIRAIRDAGFSLQSMAQRCQRWFNASN